MAHNHPIYDDEKRFIIDSITRTVKISEENRPVLIQYDHNSEHITFECDRFVEGHDLSLCDKIEVHYNNIGDRNRTNRGVYPVVDLKIHDSDESKVVFTWIVSQNATQYQGVLAFVVGFYCTNDGDIYYRWNTSVNKELQVSEGIDNSEAVANMYGDVLEMWKMDLFGIGDTEEARMLQVSQQQQNAIVAKGSHVMDTVPDEYADVQNDIKLVDTTVKVLKEASLNFDTFGNIEPVNLTVNYGYYMDGDGKLATPTDVEYGVTELVEVAPSDVYIVTGRNYGENAVYAFYDLYGNLVGRNREYSIDAGTYITDEVVVVPRNANTIRINCHANFHPTLKRVNTFYKPIHTYLERVVSSLINGSILTTEIIETVNLTGVFLQNGDLTTLSSGSASFMVTEPIEVTEGEIYRVKCGAFLNCDGYVFYNEHGVVLDRYTNINTANYEAFEGVLVVPRNAKYLRLSTAGNVSVIELAKLVGVKDPVTLPWSGKKWVAVGDSLTESNSRTTKNYHDYISDETGITVVNMGVSGSGYLRSSENNKAFYQRISTVPTDADVVTIFGSGNDLGAGADIGSASDTGTDTLCGAINTTLDTLFNVYPLVKVGIITPTPWVAYKPGDSNRMEQYSNAIVEICRNRGIPCLDLYHCSGLRPWEENYRALAYSKDDGNGVHPDETGHAIIAPRFKAFLETLIM